MVAVDTLDGIVYGFRVMGYLLLVFLIGGGAVWIGLGLVDSGPDRITEDSPTFDIGYLVDVGEFIIGLPLVFVGALTLWAGLIGISYKVIADAVERGNQASG